MRYSVSPYPKVALDFWTGPMDVFLSWLRLNLMPEELFSKEQMEAYRQRQRLVEVPDIESPEELVQWLNTVAIRCSYWDWSDMCIVYKEDDAPNGWGIVGQAFHVQDLPENIQALITRKEED